MDHPAISDQHFRSRAKFPAKVKLGSVLVVGHLTETVEVLPPVAKYIGAVVFEVLLNSFAEDSRDDGPMLPVRRLRGELRIKGDLILTLTHTARQIPIRRNCNGFLIDVDHETVPAAQILILLSERPDSLLCFPTFGVGLSAADSSNFIQSYTPTEGVSVNNFVTAEECVR